MEIIIKKILRESITDRGYNSPTYGTITADTVCFNIMLKQEIKDLGLHSNLPYIPRHGDTFDVIDYGVLTEKLQSSGLTFPFMENITPKVLAGVNEKHKFRLTGFNESDYYLYNNSFVTGYTESRANEVEQYSELEPYAVGVYVNEQTYTNYFGAQINGVSMVTMTGDTLVYVFDADKNDFGVGTPNQRNGLLYYDYSGQTILMEYEDGTTNEIQLTSVGFNGEGFNQTNTGLYANIKEDYLLGAAFNPQIESDVFINRGLTSIIERHIRLSDIHSVNEIERYNDGFFNIVRI